ncbi:MAG: hypothetical protein LBV33_03180 [Lachnospiraceae bacterium]|nr:hypothetical protein [Lachnospiraceae bacterium]
MNYVWEVLLKGASQGVAAGNIRFVPARVANPYTEVAFEYLNTGRLSAGSLDTGSLDAVVSAGSVGEISVEVNPLYRFNSVFAGLFNINITGLQATREAVFDICMHYLAQLDLRSGLDRQDYYMRFIEQDFNEGIFGREVREAVNGLTEEEGPICLYHLLQLYRTGNQRDSFRSIVTSLYKRPIMYESNDANNEILLYLGVAENETERAKIDCLISLFLPMQDKVHLFFEHHFGIIGVDETMVLDEMVLF